jgi:hypothetical protein
VKLGGVVGLEVSARPSAFVFYGVLGALAAALGVVRLNLRWPAALTLAGVGIGLHVLAVLVHHLGHATAAATVGYPMRGIRLYGPLASSVYPDDEPPLPANVHIQRAFGGPTFSFLFALVIAFIGPVMPERGIARLVWRWVLFDNLVDLGLGSFLPLEFTDGSTLGRYWGRASLLGRVLLH